jgi:hypothetical protein
VTVEGAEATFEGAACPMATLEIVVFGLCEKILNDIYKISKRAWFKLKSDLFYYKFKTNYHLQSSGACHWCLNGFFNPTINGATSTSFPRTPSSTTSIARGISPNRSGR